MAVIAKVGVIEHRGKVRTQEGVFAAEEGSDGWYTVGAPVGVAPGRLRYEPNRQVLTIERPDGDLVIDFQPEPERTVFELGGRRYVVGSMDFGNVLIKDGSRTAVQGHITIGGVRLVTVASEFLPFERELAYGLALRGSVLDSDLWREDHTLGLWPLGRP